MPCRITNDMQKTETKDFPLEDDYVVLKPLSLRSAVYLCRERASGRLLVIKLFSSANATLFAAESKALLYLGDTKLAPQMYFSWIRQDCRVLGMEWVDGTTLYDGNPIWPKEKKIEIARQLTETVEYLLTKLNYAHQDLSPKNILVKNNGSLVLVDWESSVDLSDQTLRSFNLCGTPGFMDTDSESPLPQRDLGALRSCIKFLGVDRIEEKTNPSRRGWFPWI